MPIEDVLDLLLRWAHILGAILLVGGVCYQRFVVGQISTAAPQTEAAVQLQNLQRRRWSILVMIAITLLLISGLINTALISMRFHFENPVYHALLGVKLLLALVVFFLASVLTGRSALAERLRASGKPWLMWLVMLSVITVCVAGAMKNMKRTPKDRGDADSLEQIDVNSNS